MFIVLVMTLSFSQQTEKMVNKHLQDTYQKQDYMRKRAEIMNDTMELEPAIENRTEEEGTYGVIKEAPEESFPDFSRPSKVYKPNPLESSRESVHRKKQLKQYNENLQKEYTKQYIRNAEQDNVKVYINDDKIIDNYQQTRPSRPKQRKQNGQN
ncbi:MAG: hypothetical protein KDD37_06155 [Bdellovibrionales bacterium]|nr:hypothetical protein [Bdellovibrionales bacterium]